MILGVFVFPSPWKNGTSTGLRNAHEYGVVMPKKKTVAYRVLREFDFSPTGKHYTEDDKDTLAGWTPEQVAHALQAGLVVLADGDEPDGEKGVEDG